MFSHPSLEARVVCVFAESFPQVVSGMLVFCEPNQKQIV